MDLGLNDATAVIAGGSSGMGRATAECLAADGARVALLARGQDGLDEAVAALRRLGSPDPIGLPTDLTDAASVTAAFAAVGERWGSLNMLVNAAGPLAGIGGFEQLDDAAWLRTFDGLTLSAARCVRAALPLLRAAEWARIVNVSAHSTHRQSPGLVAYTAAKAALTSLGKNLSLTLAPEGILVNTVSPGTFASESFKAALRLLPPEHHVDPDNLVDIMRYIGEAYGTPSHLPRAGDPSEIGVVIAFLASRRNSYMTGANVNVDGGSDFT